MANKSSDNMASDFGHGEGFGGGHGQHQGDCGSEQQGDFDQQQHHDYYMSNMADAELEDSIMESQQKKAAAMLALAELEQEIAKRKEFLAGFGITDFTPEAFKVLDIAKIDGGFAAVTRLLWLKPRASRPRVLRNLLPRRTRHLHPLVVLQCSLVVSRAATVLLR